MCLGFLGGVWCSPKENWETKRRVSGFWSAKAGRVHYTMSLCLNEILDRAVSITNLLGKVTSSLLNRVSLSQKIKRLDP